MKRRKSPYAPTKAASEYDRDLIRAVETLTARLGEAPTATQVGAELGITRLGARKRLLRAQRLGWLEDVPKVISSGQWAVTKAGERARGE